MIITAAYLIMAACIAESAVLDPALYLVPSLPLLQPRDSAPPGEMWGRSLEERMARDAPKESIAETTQKPVAIESRMFWPSFRSSEPTLGVHVPLTFSLSGSYGKTSIPTTVIGNTYTSMAGLGTSMTSNLGSTMFGKAGVASVYGRAALAGSSYGSYGDGVRLYGSDNVASWSGWGNGKWGHYGRG